MKKYKDKNRRGGKFNRNFNKPIRKHKSEPEFVTKDPAKVDMNALLASFTNKMVKRRPGEDNESLIKRFKRVMNESRVLSELKKREYHKSKGEKAREKSLKAKKRADKSRKKHSR